jgi:hypothetical protein
MLLAYIYRSITHRVYFLDKASRDLFICAKDLFIAAKTADGGGPLVSAPPPPSRNKKPRRSGARTMLLPLEDELSNEFDRLIAFRGNRFAAR